MRSSCYSFTEDMGILKVIYEILRWSVGMSYVIAYAITYVIAYVIAYAIAYGISAAHLF